jgi:hypothetical protein
MKTSNTKNRNTTNVKSRSTTNAKPRALYNYRPVNIGAVKFASTSKAILYMLKRSKKPNQSEIARRFSVTQACVCQLAATLK